MPLAKPKPPAKRKTISHGVSLKISFVKIVEPSIRDGMKNKAITPRMQTVPSVT